MFWHEWFLTHQYYFVYALSLDKMAARLRHLFIFIFFVFSKVMQDLKLVLQQFWKLLFLKTIVFVCDLQFLP